MARFIIVGGVAGGMSAAARLRRLDESAEIIVFERGEYVSFANCGLPYYVSGIIDDRTKLLVQTADALRDRLNLDIRTNTEVVSINRETKTVTARDSAGSTFVESYDKLILALGAEPVRPPLPGIDHPQVFSIRSIPDIDKVKTHLQNGQIKQAVIVGGGFIGIEMADNLTKIGVEVHLVEMTQQVLPSMLDPDMAALVHGHLRAQGVKLHFGSPVKQFCPQEDGLLVEMANGIKLPAGMVVLAIGVHPDINLAREAGLDVGQRGGIIVDESLRTSDPSIYAIGDAIEVTDFVTGAPALIPLAGPANKQGRMAADNVYGLQRTYRGTQGTAIVDALGLHAAGVGATSATLKRAGSEYLVSITHSFSHATYYPGGSLLSIKLLFSPESGKLLGAQIVGFAGVDKRIDVLAAALSYQGTVRDLQELELAYAPPFSSAKDPINIAGFAATNILAGHARTIQASDVEALIDRATFVDVREPSDHLIGAIAGSINIPLPQLRSRLSEIPARKPVVVYCRVGHQAYVASRILVQSGFTDVVNLAGGWRTYAALTDDKQNRPATHSTQAAQASAEIAATTLQVEGSVTMQQSTVVPDQSLDVTGLACPGPIARVCQALEPMPPGSTLEVHATDPGFTADIHAWCERTGNTLLTTNNTSGKIVVQICKGEPTQRVQRTALQEVPHDKTIVVFSGDLDKAIAAFIIATGSTAMKRKVTLFFTFWGLNVLRRDNKIRVKKGIMDRMFGMMMPRGSKRLGLSRMNMGGVGPRLIRSVMANKGVDSLELLIEEAIRSGVRIVACQMSMDVMGIKKEELLPGVEIGGVASYLGAAENADTNLFI